MTTKIEHPTGAETAKAAKAEPEKDRAAKAEPEKDRAAKAEPEKDRAARLQERKGRVLAKAWAMLPTVDYEQCRAALEKCETAGAVKRAWKACLRQHVEFPR